MIYLILFLAFILRLILIDQSFWLDEASQAMTSLRPLSEIIFNNLADFHPPLSYVLTHFWIQFGQSEIWLRLLPVLFGVGTVYIGFLLARRMFNEKVGLLFASLLAIAPYHIYYSQEFRMYSMAAFFAVLGMYFFVRLLSESEGLRLLLRQMPDRNDVAVYGFVLSSVALIYTHYLGGLLFFSQLFYLFFYDRKKLGYFLKLFSIVGLLFLPWIPFLYQQLQLGVKADTVLPGWSSMLSLSFYKAVPLLFSKFIIGRLDFDNNFLYGLIILVSFSVAGLTLIPLRKKLWDKEVGVLLCWLLIPVAITFFISFKVPMFQPFRLLFTLPAFYLLMAYGLSETKRFQKILIVLVIGMLLSFQSVFWFNSSFWREDWRTSVKEADQFIGEDGNVIFAWSDVFPTYQLYSGNERGFGALKGYPAKDWETDEKLTNSTVSGKIVYFSYLSQLTDPDKTIEQWLNVNQYKLIQVKDYRGVGFVYFYVPKEQTMGFLIN